MFDYQKTNKQKNLWELVGGKEIEPMCIRGGMRAPFLNRCQPVRQCALRREGPAPCEVFFLIIREEMLRQS